MSETGSRKTVVLADDHPIVLAGLRGLIASSPTFQVEAVAADGSEALAATRKIQPDIGVFDMQMPKLTGLDVVRALSDEGSNTRVVILTASANDEQILGAVAAGAWGILLKDSAAEKLLACLDTVASGTRWLPPEIIEPAVARDAVRRSDDEKYNGVLTSREREIAILVAQGLPNKEISRKIQISEGTVKIHLHNVYQKLGVPNRTALATVAKRYWETNEPSR